MWEGKTELVLFIVSHGRSVLNAMKSLQNGFLATVVRGNQHSPQTAHRALQRARGGETHSDSMVEGWPWLNYRLLHLYVVSGDTVFAFPNPDSSSTHHMSLHSHNGSQKSLFLFTSELWLYVFRVPILFAGTNTHGNLTYFYISDTCSHTCPKHGQTLTTAWTHPVTCHPPTFTHCPLLLILQQNMQVFSSAQIKHDKVLENLTLQMGKYSE